MKLIYLTSKNYPARTADHVYVLELARGFFHILKNDFLLVVAHYASHDLNDLPYVQAGGPTARFRTVFYFFWIPRFMISQKRDARETIFFSNDPNLLLVLIFWRLIFHYRIASDWHMLLGDWRDRFLMRKSDCLITTSQKLKSAIIKISGIREGKVCVAYGGIDLALYDPRDQKSARTLLHLPQDKYIIAYIGFFKTLGMEKGVKIMIEALPLLQRNVMMLFVGGSDREIEEYRNFAETIGVRDRCIFIGKKKSPELPLYEQAADLLSIPYPDLPHFRNYGFPMKVYEYMASNRPIIYSKLKLVEEVIGDCAFGFIPGSAADFARAVEEARAKPIKTKAYADSAYAKVQNYTWIKKAQRIVDFLGRKSL